MGNLFVNGPAELQGAVYVCEFARLGPTTVSGVLAAGFDAVFETSFRSKGATVLQSSLVADDAAIGPTTVQDDALVKRATVRTVEVAGKSSVGGELSVGGKTTADFLRVSSCANIGPLSCGGLSVSGAVALSGDISARGTIATGLLECEGLLNVKGDIFCQTGSVSLHTLAVGGNLSIGQRVQVGDTVSSVDCLASEGLLSTGRIVGETIRSGGLQTPSTVSSPPTVEGEFFTPDGDTVDAVARFQLGSTDSMGFLQLSGPTGTTLGSATVKTRIHVTFGAPFQAIPAVFFASGLHTNWHIAASSSGIWF